MKNKSRNRKRNKSIKNDKKKNRKSLPVFSEDEENIHRKRKKKKSQRSEIKRKAKKRQKRKIKLKRIIINLIISLSISTILFFLIFHLLFSLVKVDGYSMIPTLREGEWLLVRKTDEVKRFQLVYIKSPLTSRLELKRVIGLPGERIEYKDDELSVDGQLKSEYFIKKEKDSANLNQFFYTKDFSIYGLFGKSKIPDNQYFVLGDNRPYSSDSRNYGFIEKKDIVGFVQIKFSPIHSFKIF